MMAKRRAKKPPELRVVFDTQALYTKSASDLLSREVAQLIKENSSHPDLAVTWYLPEIVVHERRYQMQQRGFELLPSVRRLERLLGHNLNITESVVVSSVEQAVNRQLAEHGVQVLALVVEAVDWDEIMLDAAYRRPPFDPGEKEKGFRDALVAETFLQLVQASPATPRVCRIILITGDRLLGDAVRTRTADHSNAKVVETLEEAEGLINTLVAAVSEDFVAGIWERAKKYFFEPGEEGTLYAKESIGARIKRDFSEELSSLPAGATRRENGQWYIASPRFIKKEGQRVFWVTRISVEARAYTLVYSSAVPGPAFDTGKLEGAVQMGTLFDGTFTGTPVIRAWPEVSPSEFHFSPGYGITSSHTPVSSVPQLDPVSCFFRTRAASGKSVFEVTWSVSVSTNRRFTAPKIEAIEFIETSWEADTATELV